MEVVRGLLEHHGIQSVGVSNGEDALQAVKEFSPSLILVDLALPGLNGWELLKEFSKIPALRNVPSVAMTAYHTAEMAEQAIEAGFAAYFPKPLDATSFVRELEVIVDG
jgi:CheY-like chemotaxis protein